MSIGLTSCIQAQQSPAEQIRAAQSSGNYAEAAKLYHRLIDSGTDSPEIRSNYGIMLHLAGQNRAAMEQFRLALHGNPTLASANLFAGLTELDLGETKAAVPYLKRAQQLDPERPMPLLGLAKLYVAQHEYSLANQSYGNAAALDSNLAEAWYGLGVTDRSLAEELLNQAAKTGKPNDEVKLKVQKLLDSALRALTRAAELDPNSARVHLIMAESLSDAGKLVDAVGEYQFAIKLDPQLDAAYLGLATTYWKQRQFDEALPYLKNFVTKSPKDPEANGIMADILQRQGDNSRARDYALIALAGNPDLIETHIVLARVYLAEQQPQLAIAELHKVIAADPDGSYHFLLYRAYRQTGDEQQAKAAIAGYKQYRYGEPDR
ncbi:MAG: tetratricopeptide repeat protein [Acidobacteriota bacterium]|nr:tetratricopeptide repeat protein [Acidobacteriota bacterium]